MKPKIKEEVITRLSIIKDDSGHEDKNREAASKAISLIKDDSVDNLDGLPKYWTRTVLDDFKGVIPSTDPYMKRCWKEAAVEIGMYVPVEEKEDYYAFQLNGVKYKRVKKT